eukprot:gene10309-11409_t
MNNLELFQPIQELRDGPVYRDLSSHEFTTKEKKAMVEMIGSTGRNGKRISAESLSKRYNVPRRTIRGWKERCDEGLFLHETGGHPPILDEEAKENIGRELARLRDANNPPDKKAMHVILDEAIEATAIRQNRFIPEPDSHTVSHYFEEFGISRVTPHEAEDGTIERGEPRANAGSALRRSIIDSDLPDDEKEKLLRYAQLVERQRKKEEKAAKEKERVAKLTPDELRLEKERNKEEAKARKQRKAEELSEAQQMVLEMEENEQKRRRLDLT